MTGSHRAGTAMMGFVHTRTLYEASFVRSGYPGTSPRVRHPWYVTPASSCSLCPGGGRQEGGMGGWEKTWEEDTR